ncbi:MAG: hypothetical protein Q9196_006011 [Gyalolechia fulgens]
MGKPVPPLDDSTDHAQLLPRVGDRFRRKGSLQVTVAVARSELNELLPQGTEKSSLRLPDREKSLHWKHCEMVWQLLRNYVTIHGPLPDVQSDEIKSSLRKCKDGINAASTAGPSQQPFNAPHKRVTRAGNRADAGDNAAAVMGHLKISAEERVRYLDRYDPRVGVTPRTGHLRSPNPVTAKNLVTLVGTSWLDDTIIDNYLYLVCLHGNRVFEFTDDVMQPGSPDWYPWSVWLFRSVGTGGLWPSTIWPLADPEDVEHHFFPLLSQESHWVMFHLFHEDDKWQADFYSSRRGYEFEINARWPKITEELRRYSQGTFDVSQVQVRTPKQPIQTNDCDCGVLMLCVARWLMEGWSLDTIQADECLVYRERMILELEKWHLG